MIGEILAEYPWLWPLAWQSTLCLTAGLGGSLLLRRCAVRAHQVLLLALVAAVSIPALSQIVQRNQWGLLVAERAVAPPEHQTVAAPTDFAVPDQPMVTEPIRVPRLTQEAEASPAPVKTRFDWTRTILPAWLAVSSVLLLRLTIQFLLGRRLAMRSEVAEDSRILQMIQTAKDKLGVRTRVEVRVSAGARSPVIWCWGRRPTLLIPESARCGTDSLDWLSILCHELAHAKRRDHLSGLFAELMICALPWQPLLWWARQRLAALSEEACDDWVVTCGQRATGYARTLLGLIPQSQAALLPGVVTNRRGLSGRVRRILEDGCANPRAGWRWTLTLVVFAACASLGLAFAQTRPAGPFTRAPAVENEIPSAAKTKEDDPFANIIPEGTVRFRLTDPNGRPVAGATVGSLVQMRAIAAPDSTAIPPAQISDERGEVVFDISGISKRTIFSPNDLEEIRTKHLPQGAVYVLQKERKLGAIYGLTAADAGRSFDVRLRPLCRVHGTLSSPDLPATMLLAETYSEVQWQKIGIVQHSSETRGFDSPLPPGEYTLILHGTVRDSGDRFHLGASTRWERRPFTIRAGERDLDLGDLTLRPTRVATLIGQPAPELGPIQAWKNGPPVTMAQLRGLLVLLYFGGEHPIWQEVSALAKLQDTFGDQGLTILAIFNCASIDALEQAWPRYDPQYGQMEKVPFRVALDGGEPTVNEATGQRRLGATYGKYDILGSTMVLINQAGKLVGEYPHGEGAEIVRVLLGQQTQNTDARAKPAAPAQEEATIRADKTQLRLVDPNGRPVAGANVASFVRIRESAVLGSRLAWSQGSALSDENGQAVLETRNLFRGQREKALLYLLHEGRGIGALQEVVRGAANDGSTIVLKPTCRVHGRLVSAGLAALGMPLRWANMYVRANDDTLLECSFAEQKPDFDFPLPPGRYSLEPYGSGSKGQDSPLVSAPTQFEKLPVVIAEGQRDLDLGAIDLRPTRISTLIGRPAPEIGPMKAWKNGPAVTLAQLRGQFVWLHFGGDVPSTSRDLLKLVDLHEALGGQGITVIAIFNSASLEELDRKWAEINQRFGGVSNVPFRVAVDGGEPTFYEGTDRERAGATYGRYDIVAAPTDVLIDPAGNVLGQVNPSRAKETVSQLLGPPPGTPQTAEQQQFNQVYRLAEGEVLKRIAPPFLAERLSYYRRSDAQQAELIPRGPDRLVFHWDGALKRWGMSFGSANSLGMILRSVLGLKSYEYDGPKALLDVDLPGDWIIRSEEPQEVKLRALSDLLARELGRTIRFEKRSVPREALVATGRFQFHPPAGASEKASVHLYVTDADLSAPGGGGGTADSVLQFVQMLGDQVNMPVLDRTEPGEPTHIPYLHHPSSYLRRVQDPREKLRQLEVLLNHVTAQTDLHFEVRTEPVEVWYVTESTKP